MRIIAFATLAALLAQGCASQAYYGRLHPVSPVEARALTCEDISMELVRIEGFLDAVRPEEGFWPAVAGEDRERETARLSAQARKDQLLAVQAVMECQHGI